MSDTTTMQTVTATDLKLEIRDNMRIKLNTMIWGGPGIGKSEIPQQVADDLNANLTIGNSSKLYFCPIH